MRNLLDRMMEPNYGKMISLKVTNYHKWRGKNEEFDIC